MYTCMLSILLLFSLLLEISAGDDLVKQSVLDITECQKRKQGINSLFKHCSTLYNMVHIALTHTPLHA